eukprot:1185556-Prorocentrum_minimum.AAC.1
MGTDATDARGQKCACAHAHAHIRTHAHAHACTCFEATEVVCGASSARPAPSITVTTTCGSTSAAASFTGMRLQPAANRVTERGILSWMGPIKREDGVSTTRGARTVAQE